MQCEAGMDTFTNHLFSEVETIFHYTSSEVKYAINTNTGWLIKQSLFHNNIFIQKTLVFMSSRH